MILWRVYAGRLKFVVIIQKDDRDIPLESAVKLCDSLFHCLVFQCGYESIVACPSPEALKQIITQAELSMDTLLSAYLSDSDSALSFLLDAALVPHPLTSSKSPSFMDSFCRSFAVNLALAFVKDRMMASSTEAARLTPEEILLLRLFVDVTSSNQLVPSAPPEEASRSASPALSLRSGRFISLLTNLGSAGNSSERIVFLPHTSPNLAHKICTVTIASSEVVLVCLAGADFAMSDETRKRMEAFCLADSSFVKRTSISPPLWFSEKLAQNLPKELYGVVVRSVDMDLVFYSPVNEALSETRKNQRREGLFDFVRLVKNLRAAEGSSKSSLLPFSNEIYHFSGYFKFYFICRGMHEVYCIFDTAAPKQSLLSTIEDILNVFIRHKNE